MALDRQSSPLPVRLAREGDRPLPGTALVAGTDEHLVLTTGERLGYIVEPVEAIYRPSIDVFFDSVVRHWHGRAAGVLLTGMGADGAAGLKALRGKRHHTIAQDQATSAVYGMPKAAAAIGAAVEVLPLGRVAPTARAALFQARRGSRGVGGMSGPESDLITPLPPTSWSHHAVSVLLVDDQLMIGEAVRRALVGEPDMHFHFCNDPKLAAGESPGHRADRDPAGYRPVPGVNGLDLVRGYRADPATSRTPIIVLSTHEQPTVKRDAFAAGANDYLVKLPDRIELIARLRYHSLAYRSQIERDEAYLALHDSQEQLLAANRELQRLTNVDGLTGLSNRRYFNEYIEAEWKRALRTRAPLSMLMIDVDHFKLYNDTYGHLAGDEVLKKVAGAIRDGCRRSTDLAVRYGGEEFAADPSADPGERPAASRGESRKVRRGAHGLAHPGLEQPVLSSQSASAVPPWFPQISSMVSALIEAADKALYRASDVGRNRARLRRSVSRSVVVGLAKAVPQRLLDGAAGNQDDEGKRERHDDRSPGAEATEDTDGCRPPDAGRRRQTLDMACPIADDHARTEEADAGEHTLNDATGGVDIARRDCLRPNRGSPSSPARRQGQPAQGCARRWACREDRD